MALNLWKGSGGTAGHPSDGDFLAGANWSTGSAPDMSTDVAFAAGAYTVTLHDQFPSSVGAMTVGAGVSFDIGSNLYLSGDAVNYGNIAITAAQIYCNGSRTIANYGELLLQSANGVGGGSIYSGLIYNEGLIAAGDSSGHGDSGGLAQVTVVNDQTGAIIAFDGSRMTLLSYITNNGLIEVGVGATIIGTNPNVPGAITNLSADGTLTGGTWTVLTGGVFDFHGSAVTTLAAGTTVTLSGTGSVFEFDRETGGGPVTIDSSLSSVASGATLDLLDGRGFAGTKQLQLGGTVILDGGTFAAGGLVQASGSLLAGHGTVSAGGTLAGEVRIDKSATGSALAFTADTTFSGSVDGKGTLELSGGTDHLALARLESGSLLLDGAYVYLDANLSYGHRVALTTGALDLNGHVLTLTGKVGLNAAYIFGGDGAQLKLSGATLTMNGGGFVEVAPAIRNAGVIDVAHGILRLDGPVTGTGAFRVDAGTTLVFAGDVGSTQSVSLHDSGANLILLSSAAFHATLSGFSGVDSIDLRDIAAAGAHLSYKQDATGDGGTLKVVGSTGVASLHFDGAYSKFDFSLADDGAGGTMIGRTGSAQAIPPAGAALGHVDGFAFADAAHQPLAYALAPHDLLHGHMLAIA